MNAKLANRISIRNYLSSIGINPVSSNKSSSLYLAPYRADTNPSLKVSHDQNLWVDYGNDNKGGTLIDLVLQIYPSYDVSDAIRAIEKSTQSFFSFHQQDFQTESFVISQQQIANSKQQTAISKQQFTINKQQKGKVKLVIQNTKHEKAVNGLSIPDLSNDGTDNPCNHNTGTCKQQYLTQVPGTLSIYKLKELGNNLAITEYLNRRGIQTATAKPFCEEIYYTINSKTYFGLANRNSKGWSIRNKYWKGCTAQGYSYYKRGFERLCVFEGIFDLLSFIELNKHQQIETDFLVLNSLVNLKGGIAIIETYHHIDLFLDHDQAGRKATKALLDSLPHSRDTSSFYSSCKDLNDYHLLKNKEQLLIGNPQLVKDNCYPPRFVASHVLARPKRLLR